jgi:tRNA U34 5-methylaminomethyl-2-thiouridine-forming methyltransferase MnmC
VKVRETADGTLTLEDPASGQTYRSIHGAATESRLVFLQNSGVAARLNAGEPTRVLEIGFGTGLNFCITATLAIENRCQLHYAACEFALPDIDLLESLLQHNLPDARHLTDELVALLAQSSDGEHSKGCLSEWVELDLYRGDARTASWPDAHFDAIYLDAFSARCNPQLWQRAFLAQLRPTLHKRGRLATFGVNRAFRQALSEAGFSWSKYPGPPGKREVLVATKAA